MDQAATTNTEAGPVPATQQPTVPWEQQPDENGLWYARFVRFVALGPTRSVSLVATGRRNAYPVPAHWPIQAKQMQWRERAHAFDVAAKADPALVDTFNGTIVLSARLAAPKDEAFKMDGVAYTLPEDDEYEDRLASGQ